MHNSSIDYFKWHFLNVLVSIIKNNNRWVGVKVNITFMIKHKTILFDMNYGLTVVDVCRAHK